MQTEQEQQQEDKDNTPQIIYVTDRLLRCDPKNKIPSNARTARYNREYDCYVVDR